MFPALSSNMQYTLLLHSPDFSVTWVKDLPSYRLTPHPLFQSGWPNHRFPARSWTIEPTKSLSRPSFVVKVVNDLPSYRQTPSGEPNHSRPALSFSMVRTFRKGGPPVFATAVKPVPSK